MSKKTCTPARKALAKRFKSGDLHNESAQRLVAQLLEEEPYDADCLRAQIKALMARGMTYEQAKEQALAQPASGSQQTATTAPPAV